EAEKVEAQFKGTPTSAKSIIGLLKTHKKRHDFYKYISENSIFILFMYLSSDCEKLICSLLSEIFRLGSLIINSIPSPHLLFTEMLPPCISTKDFTKDNPIPLPSLVLFREVSTCTN